MPEVKQYSLFVSHEAPIDIKPESTVSENIEVSADKSDKKVNLYSAAAAKILTSNNHKINNSQAAAAPVFIDFNLDACRSCGSIKLIKYDNVYVCKTCGSENTLNGVLFGDKLKKKER